MRVKNIVICLGLAVPTFGAAGALPVRQAGLWEIRLDAQGQAPVTVQQCTAPAADAVSLTAVVPAPEPCVRDVKHLGKAWRMTMVCESHGQKLPVTVQLQGDFKTRY